MSNRFPSNVSVDMDRKKRQLRVGPAELYPVTAADGVQLRLTRYRGGSKGPVILSHGLSVSSLIFAIDTIDTNLLEYLFAFGYDVWLLDYRASIDLPASEGQFTGDEIGMLDYPAAVDQVLQATGASSVQMVAHCFGAITFTMAMLAGLQGVRSAVCSQVSAHVKTSLTNRIKVGIHTAELLEALGVHSLSAYAGSNPDWQEKLYEGALRLYPGEMEERCSSPVCRRVNFIYGPLYEHDRLNSATHSALHEMLGTGCMDALQHSAVMSRAGHVVDAQGRDVYMPHIDRMAIPIAFIHGTDNVMWLPESTAITYSLLRETNGHHLYTRRLIQDYGHLDCIFGEHASRDVYPYILEHLEATAT